MITFPRSRFCPEAKDRNHRRASTPWILIRAHGCLSAAIVVIAHMFDWDEVPEQLGGPNKAALQVEAEAGSDPAAAACDCCTMLLGFGRPSESGAAKPTKRRLQPSAPSDGALKGRKAVQAQASGWVQGC